MLTFIKNGASGRCNAISTAFVITTRTNRKYSKDIQRTPSLSLLTLATGRTRRRHVVGGTYYDGNHSSRRPYSASKLNLRSIIHHPDDNEEATIKTTIEKEGGTEEEEEKHVTEHDTEDKDEGRETDNGDDNEEETLLLNEIQQKSTLKSLLSDDCLNYINDNYTLHPAPSIITGKKLRKGQRIVTFGDVHGDINKLKEFLVVAGVLDPKSLSLDPSDVDDDENPKYIGKDTICVQVGDITDRGDDELKCYRLLCSLSKQAAKEGGLVTTLWGNHESLNALGLMHYTTPDGNGEYEQEMGSLITASLPNHNQRWKLQYANNQPSRWSAMEPSGLLSSTLLGNMNVCMVVGSSIFVHAGLTKQHINQYGSISEINNTTKQWINEIPPPLPPKKSLSSSDDDDEEESHKDNNKDADYYNNLGLYTDVEDVINAAQHRADRISKSMPSALGGGSPYEAQSSPVWMRDYSSPANSQPKNLSQAQLLIDSLLEKLNNNNDTDTDSDAAADVIDPRKVPVKRIIVGHTPQDVINSALKDKVWRVDIGASKGIGNNDVEVLEIIHQGGNGEDDKDEDVITILKHDGKRVNGADRDISTILNSNKQNIISRDVLDLL